MISAPYFTYDSPTLGAAVIFSSLFSHVFKGELGFTNLQAGGSSLTIVLLFYEMSSNSVFTPEMTRHSMSFYFLFSENQPVELTTFFSISYIENSMAFSHGGARTKTVPFCNFISIGNANTKGLGEFEILLALMHFPLLSVVKSLALTLSSYGLRN